MTALTPEQEEQLRDMAEALVPFAAELVGCVHDYGRAEIEAVIYRHLGLSPAMGDEVQTAIAAMVVLAAMVNPDRSADELLTWTLVDPRMLPLTPARAA
ncbi:hypothetical protein G1H11_14250 [Phytoactinopolyspora alkaliphila]|uniref:Uncharacterized protein n=1 Tax=Phytoactinopolyspora alkaliphila TaxID=1783498 RepID=A0A6N9YNQ4_9ACTN|nr:hypothetical protein [Phytoactinopolyspora alkaliphila]NED96468.1 hypothetical protein [Phytoactinopolyspora alkaliphila]